MANSTQQRGYIPAIGTAIAALVCLALALAPSAQAQKKFKVLYSFGGQPDGWIPTSMSLETKGALYGATAQGGSESCTYFGQEYGCGMVFKVSSTGKESVLYNFTGYAYSDGENPTTGLIQDVSGNIYGTTWYGGTGSCSDDGLDAGCGTVFKIDRTGKETVLYSFTDQPDGASPSSGVIIDSKGNLYGTTLYGGTYGYGTVFKLDTSGQETVLYSFAGGTADGGEPYAGLYRDKAGNLYGTTILGGTYFFGTVFKVDATGHETVLYSFSNGQDGGAPASNLIRDAKGNFYSTTQQGGDSSCNHGNGCGTVFKITPNGTLRTLHAFTGGKDGAVPYHVTLILDNVGNIYGSTAYGGNSSCSRQMGCGTVFKLTKAGKDVILHRFTGGADGAYPVAGVGRDAKGNVYGTASGGGNTKCDGGCGTVWKLTP